MMTRGTVVSRTWQLVALLDSRRGYTLSELRSRLDCSLRTVMRDLKALQDAGFPIFDERDGREKRWKFVEGFKNRIPPPFGLSELMALYFARALCRPLEHTPIYRSLEEAFKKISFLLPPASVAFMNKLNGTISHRPGPFKDYSCHRKLIAAVTRARLKRRGLDIVYESFARREITQRRVDPYRLFFYDGGLYIIGYDHLRQQIRIFALERMKQVSQSASKFTLPKRFDFDKYMQSALGIFRGPSIQVRILFSSRVAPYVLERQWHPSQQTDRRQDGEVALTLSVANTLELRRWVLSFGSEAEVLEPKSLREEIRNEAQGILEQLERWDLAPNQLFLPSLEWGRGVETRVEN